MGKPHTIMYLGVVLSLVHFTLCIQAVSAQPYTSSSMDDGPDRAVVARANPRLVRPSNGSFSAPGGSSQTRIFCFEAAEGRDATSIDTCRSVLNRIRRMPFYRLVQEFQEERCPKIPSKPPYFFIDKGSNCAIQIASGSLTVIDKFSFEQARALATDILEDCQGYGGYGGVAPLGRGIGWTVKLIGLGPDGFEEKGPATGGP